MRYALVKNGAVVQGPTSLPKAFGNISGFHYLSNEELKKHGWLPWNLVEVVVEADEVYGPSSIVISASAVVETQTKRKKTADELAADVANKATEVRAKRDELIAETDWIVIKSLELGQSVPSAFEVYRQALRDVPAQSGFPFNVTWPVKP
jgi:hypothetical protein